MPTIRLEHVTKYYRWERRLEPAVQDVSLTVEQGDFLSVIGSSGAGKSTLLHLMAGSIAPSEGSVLLDGMDLAKTMIWNRPQVRRVFGMVCQEPQLMRTRTIRENLSIVARIGRSRGSSPIEQRVSKALSIVGMAGVEEKYPGELSVGEFRRVELARALINSPSILVLDELTGNLDEDNIWDILHLLTELNRQGTTVVMSTHASTFVNILHRRVVTLADGRIISDVKRGGYGQRQIRTHGR